VYLTRDSFRLEGGIAQYNKEIGQAYQYKSVKYKSVKYKSVKYKNV
jgi:hypothetical protein